MTPSTEVEESLPPPARARAGSHVVIVGTGPCGTFAALRLTEAGARVTLVDLGKPVQPRRHDLASLTQRGELDPDSNYCFGEGGAGTFSDGKLYTRTKDRRAVRTVLRALVAHGADPEILVESRPHVGSNRLPKILMAQRSDLEARGAAYVWSDGVVDLLARATAASSACAAPRGASSSATRWCSPSATRRDRSVRALPSPRRRARAQAVRRRRARRASAAAHRSHPVRPRARTSAPARRLLPPDRDRADAPTPASAASTASACARAAGSSTRRRKQGALCVNGMSLKRRDSPFANAALVVTVEPRDYLGRFGDGPLAGIELQRAIERRAFAAGGGGFVAPAQRLADFVARRADERAARLELSPARRRRRRRAACCRRSSATRSSARCRVFKEPCPASSAPRRSWSASRRARARPCASSATQGLASPTHPGLYPAGEGAGYAGGIVSAAVDGIRAADAILGNVT